jgi:phosphoglycerol geranylgeranyltransferase
MKNSTHQNLRKIIEKNGAGFIMLLDPDKLPLRQIEERIPMVIENGVDMFFIGGSFLLQENFNEFVSRVKKAAGQTPVILFPGSVYQISPHADAILYLSLLSGRNPAHLIDNQVLAAPIIWQSKVEPISCAYLLVESGQMTSAEFMSNSRPLPRDKTDLALAHALAAEYLGFKLVYLEAGSGARLPVPDEMIASVGNTISIPLIVGGGIRTPQEAENKVKAGASFIVIGNYFENPENHFRIRQFAEAIHRG